MNEIDKYLTFTNPKNESTEFFALACFAFACFEADNLEMVDKILERCDEIMRSGRGYSNPDNQLSPSIVELNEFMYFMGQDADNIRANGEAVKKTAREALFEYFKDYILPKE